MVDKFDSLEAAYIYKNYVDEKDAAFLLFDLANEGYIEIIEKKNDDALSSEVTYIIRKIKDYDGNKKYEEGYMLALFKNGDEASLSAISLASMTAKLCLIGDDFKYSINDKKKLLFQKVLLYISVFIFILLSLIVFFYTNNDDIIYPIIMFMTIGFVISYNSKNFVNTESVCILLELLYIEILGRTILFSTKFYSIFLFFSVILIIFLIAILFFNTKSRYGNNAYLKIKEYRENVKNNFSFYDIPYIYTLNIDANTINNLKCKPKWLKINGNYIDSIKDIVMKINKKEGKLI